MSLVDFLDRTRIITHPKPGPHNPCVTVSEIMWARWFTPQWLAVWRAWRTIRRVYPNSHTRMTVTNAYRIKTDWMRYHQWTVVFDAGCKERK